MWPVPIAATFLLVVTGPGVDAFEECGLQDDWAVGWISEAECSAYFTLGRSSKISQFVGNRERSGGVSSALRPSAGPVHPF